MLFHYCAWIITIFITNQALALKPIEQECLKSIQHNADFKKIRQVCSLANIENMNFHGEDGNSPLHYASELNRVDVIHYLCSIGASVSIMNRWGLTPLHAAAGHNALAAIVVLIHQGSSIESQDNEKHTPLFIAVEYGNIAAVKLLISLGSNVNAEDKFQENPFQLAAGMGLVGILSFLKANKAHIKKYSQMTGKNALHLAVEGRQLKSVVFLIQNGFLINQKTLYSGDTPLGLATRYNFLDIAQYLLQKHAQVNMSNYAGQTPLYLAVIQNNFKMIKLLLSYGANPMMMSKRGINVYQLAFNLHRENLFSKKQINLFLSENF